MKIKALLLRPLVLKFKFYKKSDMTIVISIKSKDTIKALHISVFKVRIAWRCIAIMTKSPNRSVSILLRRQLSIYLIQIKGVSATVLPTRTMRSILRFLGVQAKCTGSESFCCRVQSDFNLINLPWKCAGKDITRSCFFLYTGWVFFTLFWS